MNAPFPAPDRETGARKAALALLTAATRAELELSLSRLTPPPVVRDLRKPEIGLVMVRGRIGGGGAPFNLGEATVTRAAVEIDGVAGHGHVLGRDKARARLVAVFDALWQASTTRLFVERGVLAEVRARVEAEDALARARTAATRVDFFTMVRGE